MKVLLRVVLQREMVLKWQDFWLLYHLVKAFAIASITRKLVVNYLLNLWKTSFLRFSKVAATPQGMCLFKMVIQVKTPKLLKVL